MDAPLVPQPVVCLTRSKSADAEQPCLLGKPVLQRAVTTPLTSHSSLDSRGGAATGNQMPLYNWATDRGSRDSAPMAEASAPAGWAEEARAVDSAAGALACAPDAQPPVERQRCFICLEDKPSVDLVSAGDICPRPDCKQTFCRQCLGDYFADRVASGRFALTPMACVACHGKVPVSSWCRFATGWDCSKYEYNAGNMLAYRCPSCDCTGGLWNGFSERSKKLFLAMSRDSTSVQAALSSFLEYEISPDDLVGRLKAHGPACLCDPSPERRGDETGSYTQLQCLKWYDWKPLAALGAEGSSCVVCGCSSETDALGDRICWCDSCRQDGCVNPRGAMLGEEHDRPRAAASSDQREAPLWSGLYEWERAAVWRPARRVASDGHQYTLADFESYYGEEAGCQRWEAAAALDIHRVLNLIEDVERRTAVHLAYLRKNPHIRTPCCGEDYCFKCQTQWHHGQTCAEVEQWTVKDVQLCPECSVPTQRSEGCTHMVCLCGANWSWSEEHDEDDEGEPAGNQGW